MPFTEFLRAKQKLLILWLAMHTIALIANVFGVYAGYHDFKNSGEFGKNYSIHILTSEYRYYGGPSKEFWPFVEFIPQNRWDYFSYNGLFYCYDISEFILYNFLFFLILYLIWDTKYRNRNAKPKNQNELKENVKLDGQYTIEKSFDDSKSIRFSYRILSEVEKFDIAWGKYVAYRLRFSTGKIDAIYKGKKTGRYFIENLMGNRIYCNNIEDAIAKLYLSIHG